MNAASLPMNPPTTRFSRRDALITAAILASGTLWNNGCASKSGDKLRIWSMWAGDEGKYFLDTLGVFEKAHPGILCENLGAVDDQKSVRAIVAGAPPDLLTLKDPLFLGTLAANDALEPLDSFLSDAGLSEADFAPGALSQCTINGRGQVLYCSINIASNGNCFASWTAHFRKMRIGSKSGLVALSVLIYGKMLMFPSDRKGN